MSKTSSKQRVVQLQEWLATFKKSTPSSTSSNGKKRFSKTNQSNNRYGK